MEAEYIDQTADEVTVRMVDERRRVTFSKKLLSEADLTFLNDHVISQKYDSLVKNIYQSKADVEREARFSKQPIIVIWRNEMHEPSFRAFMVELLEDEAFNKVIKDRSIFVIMDNPDFHMNLANYGVHDNDKGSPILTYYRPEWYGGLDKPVDVSALTDRSILIVTTKMRAYLANYYDYPRSGPQGELPAHWKVNVTGEPQTLFEVATLAAQEKKSYVIIYGDGLDKASFPMLQSTVEGKFDPELLKRYKIAFVFEDPELSARLGNIPYSQSSKRLRIVLFSDNHQIIEIREISRTASIKDSRYLVTTINEMMEEGGNVRTNGATSNPFQ